MTKNTIGLVGLAFLAQGVFLLAVRPARAQEEKNPYPAMAPLSQYLIPDRNAEIALARSAAPPAISDKADVMVLGKDGYTTAEKGSNGFVCIVERSWANSSDAPQFWNPRMRAPHCFNPAAAKSFLPIFLFKTKLALAGKSPAEIGRATAAAFARKKLPRLEPGAMAYMMSKQQYLNDRAKNWHPHVMFFVSGDVGPTWGANLEGSPMIAVNDAEERVTVFMVLVDNWSDGTPDPQTDTVTRDLPSAASGVLAAAESVFWQRRGSNGENSGTGVAIRRRLYMMSCPAMDMGGASKSNAPENPSWSGVMEMKTPGRGSAATAGFFSFLICVLVVVTVYIFMAGKYPPPPSITRLGLEVDHQYQLTLIVTGIVFVLSQLGLAFVVFRFRDHGQRVEFSRGSNTLEIVWTVATIILFLGLGIMARHAWAASHFTGAAPDAIQIEVTGNQFVWNFRYPGPDGRFGRLDPTMISASSGNPLGLDPADHASKDDIVVPTVTVPVGRQVELLLRSQDVIHSFFVRELRLKQDAVPGMIIPMYFTADQIGQYEIVCTQLCGLGHYRMESRLNVVSDEDYKKFIDDQEKQLLPPPAPAPVTPATATPK